MTAQRVEGLGAVVGHYADRLGGPNASLPRGIARGTDELVSDGHVRQGSDVLARAVNRFGTIGLQTRRRTVERLLADDGVTYGGSLPGRPARPWLLDPLPLVLDAAEWATLESGLEQRARLFEAVLDDLSGPRRLLVERILPAEVVAGHPGFLPPTHGVRQPGGRALPLVAIDLARATDGRWVVIADRTQAPSGAGYAMANRRIVARALEPVHRHVPLRRLRGWFDTMQIALQNAAPSDVDDVPRVVLLTPGPASETSYDQGLLSTLLGHPLAQSDDLVTRGGRLWLRTTGRLEAVDVVLRRVDAAWSDPLDLLSESRLGVPGLVAAARRGTVSIVNPLRASVLENPGLIPFLGDISRALIDEEPALESPQTWWCGDPTALSHVLSGLSRLLVKPIARTASGAPLVGWRLDAAQLDELRDRIRTEPWAWTAQDPVVPSTAPIVTPLGLEPRNVVLRTFGVALGPGYHFLPGGLARAASAPDAFTVTNSAGATSKDVWVLEPEDGVPAPRIDLAELARARALAPDASLPGLTPRAASNLYWMGRYAERAEFASRLLIVADNVVEDHARRPDTPGHAAMRGILAALTEVTSVRPGFSGQDAEARLADPLPHLLRLLVDADTPGTVAHSARRAAESAVEVRELLSFDTAGVLSRLSRTLVEARELGADAPIQQLAARTLESLLALSGLSAESLFRDPTWAFLDAGRRMERAQTTLRLLRSALGVARPPVAEAQVAEAVLRVGDSLITHRRRQAAGVGPVRPAPATLVLLIRDASNPRSVAFQLERFRDTLAHAPSPALSDATREVLGRVRKLEPETWAGDDRSGLVFELASLEDALRELSDALVATHFVTQAPQIGFAVNELSLGEA